MFSMFPEEFISVTSSRIGSPVCGMLVAGGL
jgi:hypothetical protein